MPLTNETQASENKCSNQEQSFEIQLYGQIEIVIIAMGNASSKTNASKCRTAH